MAADDPAGPHSRNQARVPLDTEVQLEFENFSGFIREISANLSLGGIFVRTRYLKPVGTVVRFEFRLKDHYRLIRGSGEVVWTRWRDQPPEMSAGMGIQFVDLDAESRALVAAIVEQHIRGGGSPFDLEQEPQPADDEFSRRGSYAEGLPPGAGPPVSDVDMSEWLRSSAPGLAGGSSGDAPPAAAIPPEPPIQIAFAEPPELPPAPMPALPPEASEPALPGLPAMGDAWASGAVWRTETARQPRPQSARPLDWGAAEAMAALGIEPSSPVTPATRNPRPTPAVISSEAEEESSPLVPPEPRAVAVPLFGGGQAASARQPSRFAWRVGLPIALVALGALAWFLLQSRRPAEHAPVAVVESPASARRPVPPAAVAPPKPKPEAPASSPSSPSPPVSAAPAPAPAASAVAVESPAADPAAGGAGFSAVDRITWQEAGGETEVVLWTNGVVSARDVEHVRLESAEPREVLKLHGVSRAFTPSQLLVGNPELRQIRVGFHEQKPNGQLHIVFDLGAPEIRVLSLRADGARLRVRLGRE